VDSQAVEDAATGGSGVVLAGSSIEGQLRSRRQARLPCCNDTGRKAEMNLGFAGLAVSIARTYLTL
jgi:hypothetical protein